VSLLTWLLLVIQLYTQNISHYAENVAVEKGVFKRHGLFVKNYKSKIKKMTSLLQHISVLLSNITFLVLDVLLV